MSTLGAYLKNRPWEFNQSYSFTAVLDKDEFIRFWNQGQRSSHDESHMVKRSPVPNAFFWRSQTGQQFTIEDRVVWFLCRLNRCQRHYVLLVYMHAWSYTEVWLRHYLINCLWEFNQIYSFSAVGTKNTEAGEWCSRSKGQVHSQHFQKCTFPVEAYWLMVQVKSS